MATAGGAAGKRRGKGDHREGYLMKKSPGMLKLWQRRYFVLDDGVLTYYKDHRDVGIKYLKQVRLPRTPLPCARRSPDANSRA